jgi:hypothetical protein
MAGREFQPIIEPVHRCRDAGADERRRLDHHGAGKATARMTIVQQKERHSLRCSARKARSGGRQAVILIIAASWADRLAGANAIPNRIERRPLATPWQQKWCAWMLPQVPRGIRGPNEGTGTSSGHASTLTSA